MPNRTLKYLASKRPESIGEIKSTAHEIPFGRQLMPRQSWNPCQENLDLEVVASRFRNYSYKDAVVFPDTGMLIDKRVSVLSSPIFLSRKLFVINQVLEECAMKLDNPPTLALKAIRDRLSGANNNVCFQNCMNYDLAMQNFMNYYVKLLSVRRFAHHFEYQSVLNGKEFKKGEIDPNKIVGERGSGIAAKNKEALPTKFTDECLVVNAMLYALTTGKETFVVTQDGDVLENCYKLFYLLDTDYRAMLLAQHYASFPQEYVRSEVRWDHPMFSWNFKYSDDAFCIRHKKLSKSKAMNNVLPSNCTPVIIYCYLVAKQYPYKVQTLTFCIDYEMSWIIPMKFKASNKNTNLFANLDCHVNPDYVLNECNKPVFAENNINANFNLPRIQLDLSLKACETFAQINQIETQIIA